MSPALRAVVCEPALSPRSRTSFELLGPGAAPVEHEPITLELEPDRHVGGGAFAPTACPDVPELTDAVAGADQAVDARPGQPARADDQRRGERAILGAAGDVLAPATVERFGGGAFPRSQRSKHQPD